MVSPACCSGQTTLCISSASPAGSAVCCPLSIACAWREGAGGRRGLYHGALFTLRASGRRRHDCQRSAQCAVDPGRIDWRIAVGTHVVDQMCAGRRDGGNCVSEQVCSGTAHVGKRSQAESLILRTTQAEIGLGALALLAVSLFATWEPY